MFSNGSPYAGDLFTRIFTWTDDLLHVASIAQLEIEKSGEKFSKFFVCGVWSVLLLNASNIPQGPDCGPVRVTISVSDVVSCVTTAHY